MIYLTKGQKLFSDEGMVVCDPTGYYEDGAAVSCAAFHSPEIPVFRYEAKFIAYGDQVYSVSDQDKLMEEITKIDPETLLGKTNADVKIDNLVQEIKTVENPTPELTQEAVDKNNKNTDNKENEEEEVIEENEPQEEDIIEDTNQEDSIPQDSIEENTTPNIEETDKTDDIVVPEESVTTDNPIDSVPEIEINNDPNNSNIQETEITEPISILTRKRKKKIG